MELFTQQEVLKTLKISRQCLYTIRKKKKIKGKKIGRGLRFTQADIERMLN
jgi:predicted DNA-binding transcriptional regulator AlpA